MPRNELEVALTLRDRFTSGLRSARSGVRTFARQVRQSLRRVSDVFGRLRRSIFSVRNLLVGLAGAFVVRGFGRLISSVTDFGDELAKLNTRLGLSAEFMTELRFAGESAGIEFNTLSIAFQRAIRRFGEIEQFGRGTASKAFEILGKDIEAAVKQGQTFEQLLPTIADRFASLENEQKKVTAAFGLFDAEGVKLLQLLNQGSEGIEQMRARARELGIVFSTELARDSEEFTQAVTDLRESLRGLLINAIAPLLPQLTSLTKELTDFFTENRGVILDFLADVLEGLASFGRAVVEVAEKIQEPFEKIAEIGERIAAPFRFFRDAGVEIRGFLQNLLGVSDASQQQQARTIDDIIADQLQIVGLGGRQQGFSVLDRLAGELRARAAATRFPFVGPRLPGAAGALPAAEGGGTGTLFLDTLSGAFQETFREMREAFEPLGEVVAMTREKFQAFVDFFTTPIPDALDGARQTLQRFEDELSSFAISSRLTADLVNSLRFNLGDALFEAARNVDEFGQAMRNFGQSLLQDIGRAFTQSASDFLVGGLVRGVRSVIPRLQTAQFGGVFDTPTVIAERPGLVEAAVPLPQNRKIPVELRGNVGGGNITVQQLTIQALDQRSVADLVVEGAAVRQEEVARIVLAAVNRSQTNQAILRT